MLALISQRHAFSLQDFAANEKQHGVKGSLTCFSSFVAGSTNMAAGTQRVRFLPFRYLNTCFHVFESIQGSCRCRCSKRSAGTLLNSLDHHELLPAAGQLHLRTWALQPQRMTTCHALPCSRKKADVSLKMRMTWHLNCSRDSHMPSLRFWRAEP